jgi:PqqD family protein of HPr-rel-A system
MWDGEAALYDDLSGDTFKLDIIMAEIFARLQQGGATPDELVQHLAQTLDIEADLRLERLVELALERFEDSGLAMPATALAPDGS